MRASEATQEHAVHALVHTLHLEAGRGALFAEIRNQHATDSSESRHHRGWWMAMLQSEFDEFLSYLDQAQ
jgi:hypothetical protein